MTQRILASGNEAIAMAAFDCGVNLGVGYPGTPSSEILDEFSKEGGTAQWAPNEKTALEVGIGVAFANGRSLVTMKHVGLNVAADPLFTIAYSGTPGGLVVVSADDPGMASSQNEQDNRRYAIAAGVPMLEPADSQECYDFLIRAFELSEADRRPVLRSLKKYHGKPGAGAGVEFNIRTGPITMLSIGVNASGKFRFVIAEGESVPGPIPPTGNTNTHGRFAPDVRTFLKRWCLAGPTHHFALGVGRHARAIERVAATFGVESVIVTGENFGLQVTG